MPDDGSAEFAQHLTITALPALSALPTLTTEWGGLITGLPAVSALPRVSP
jgi:hypothetical protein